MEELLLLPSINTAFMHTLFMLLISLMSGPGRAQPTVPPLPDSDYAVLASALNYLSDCDNPQRSHRRGELLFIKTVTQTQAKHGFNVKAATDQNELSFLLGPAATFHTQPDWASFLSSIDSARFTPHRLEHSLKLACRESQIWSQQQYDAYFGSPASKGHWGLSKEYPNYGGVVSLSTVAYSTDRAKAVCYCSIVSDYKAGAGNLVFLERQHRQWIVVGNATLWVS